MTTSANVVFYEIYVGEDLIETFRQHIMCKDSVSEKLNETFKKYPMATLRINHPDENECDVYGDKILLGTFLLEIERDKVKSGHSYIKLLKERAKLNVTFNDVIDWAFSVTDKGFGSQEITPEEWRLANVILNDLKK